jgi:hypothetical protein
MVVKTQRYNKTYARQKLVKHNTKKHVARRTSKNNLKLRGGGDDIEIYYSRNFLKGGNIIASTSMGELKKIPYKMLSELPTIKLNRNDKYKIIFLYKDYDSNPQQQQQRSTSSGTPFAEYELERKGMFTTTKTNEKITKLTDLVKLYASELKLNALTIIIKLYKGTIDKTTKTTIYPSSTSPTTTYYFNLNPIR